MTNEETNKNSYLLIKKVMKQKELTNIKMTELLHYNQANEFAGIMTKLKKGHNVSTETLWRIADALDMHSGLY